MKNELRISIITPFYKGNLYLEQLFTVVQNNYEVLRTKYPQAEVELILVNDSPETDVVVPDCIIDYQYRVINHSSNSGIHQARVTGLNECTGNLVLFLDQDDVLNDETFLKQADIMFREKASIVVCNTYMEVAKGASNLLYKTKTDYKRINDLVFYLKSHNVIKSPGQCLIKKKDIPSEWKEYIMHQNGSDDLFLWILFLEKEYRFTINKEPLYIHKYTGENLSDSETKMAQSSLEMVAYLAQIKYVPQKDIKMLKKSREFSLSLREKSIAKRMKTVICNFDLFCYLAINKIKRVLI